MRFPGTLLVVMLPLDIIYHLFWMVGQDYMASRTLSKTQDWQRKPHKTNTKPTYFEYIPVLKT